MDNLTSTEILASQKEQEQQEKKKEQRSDEVAEILAVETEEEVAPQETVEELTKKAEALTREEIVEQMRQLCDAGDFSALKSKAGVLRNVFNEKTSAMRKERLEAFLADGGAEEDFKRDSDKTEEEFNRLYVSYKEKRQRYIEQQEKEKIDNLAKKQAVLAELRELLQSEGSLKEIYDNFNTIQEKWKAIGAVPRAEINTLWENYRFLIEQFFDKVKISRELRGMGLKKNLEEKLALCERVEG